MKVRRMLALLVPAAALAAAAGIVYPAIYHDWFAQTFDGLTEGTSFTGGSQGATGGSWATIESGVAIVTNALDRKGITLDTRQSPGLAISFTASDASGYAAHGINFALDAQPTGWYPAVTSDDKLLLCLLQNDGSEMTFGAYCSGVWKKLYGHGIMLHRAQWIDCRAEFQCNSDGKAHTVRFYLCGDSGAYMPLVDSGGSDSITLSTSIDIRTLTFRGLGLVGAFKGQRISADDSRIHTWTGTVNKQWNVPGNWKDNKVPANGDLATVTANKTITFGTQTLVTSASSKISIVSNDCLHIWSGKLQISSSDNNHTNLGTVIVEPTCTLTTHGRYKSIELGVLSTLIIDKETLTITGSKAFYLDGVNLSVLYYPSGEGGAVITAPYGSGGTPQTINVGGSSTTYNALWYGQLDGSTTLWVVKKTYSGETAIWNDGAWGNLLTKENWSPIPLATRAALMRYGKAHVNADETFAFTRRFDIGTQADESGEISMSGGSLADGAVVVGAEEGNGTLDVVGGTVEAQDYLWYPALTIGADTKATGLVTLRGGRLRTTEKGNVSVGSAGTAHLTLEKGKTLVEGSFAVGYIGTLDMTGGSLIVSNSMFIGRTTRTEAYDVTMTVSGGSISNVAEGAGSFWIGSYGGLGSRAVLNLTGGEIFSDNPLAVGACRSAEMNVLGGTLIAPTINLGSSFIDAEETAAFTLDEFGRVETAGFTAGTTGSCAVTLADGEIVATAESDDFFAGLDIVRLEGETTLNNANDVTITSALTGPGGLVKIGAGKLTVSGYTAWAGKTIVSEGILDMDGGMIMGELEMAADAVITNEKYDNFNALPFTSSPWSSGTASTSPYLRLTFTLAAGTTGEAKATDANGVLKGAVKRTETGIAGYTALGWIQLLRLDGTPVGTNASNLRMFFDFNGGKPYVVYEIQDGENWERLACADGLTVYPAGGTLLSVKNFSGVTLTTGEALTIATGSVLYWIGADGGEWNNGSNWSETQGGTAVGKHPTASSTAIITTTSAIKLTSGCVAGAIVIQAPTTLSGATLTVGGDITGVGRLILAGASVTSAHLIDVPVEVSGVGNVLTGGATLSGALDGSGAITLAGKLYGDTHAFEGSAELTAGGFFAQAAENNALSAWTLSGAFPFGLDNTTYVFGELNGTMTATADDADAIALSVGDRDRDCILAGGWPTASESRLTWTAATASLTCSVKNLATLALAGGGSVLIPSAEGFPAEITFVNEGGALQLGSDADIDLSTVIRQSTAPITFDDAGTDRTWNEALDASNTGGFVKRGAGTLVWLKAPGSIINVTVEAGTLVVPYGTRLGAVRIADGAQLILDMGGVTHTGTALAIDSADRALTAPRFSIENAVDDYKTSTNDRNGIVVYCGSETFVWAGGDSGDWDTLANWRVDGAEATRLPTEQDDVVFNESATVTLATDVRVRTLTGAGNLTVLGEGRALALDASLSLTGSASCLTLDHISFSAADALLATLNGTGSVYIVCGELTLTPDPDADRGVFVGTLNVTNLVKRGEGPFEFMPLTAFDGTMALKQGRLYLNGSGDMTNQPAMHVTMSAGTALELCDHAVNVASFVGAGTIETNGLLVTADHTITQLGGELSLPAVDNTTYVASRVGEPLLIQNAAGLGTKIVIPRTWFKAGTSGRHAIFCENTEIVWEIERTHAQKPVYEGDGWWSIPGGGFTVRLR